jgi:hypothetical protein
MTRAEQAAEKVKKHREKLDAMQKAFEARMAEAKDAKRKAEALQREEDRKVNRKKRAQWGAIADEAGLFTWSTPDFVSVCAVLKRYLPVTHPARTLEALLRDKRSSLSEGVSRDSDTATRAPAPAVSSEIAVG